MFNLKLSALPASASASGSLSSSEASTGSGSRAQATAGIILLPRPTRKVKFNNLRLSLRQRVIPNLQMQVTVGDSRVDCRSQVRLKKSRNFLGATL